ncbi:MAG: hypothetical protein QM747_12190 [Nocardioides sp.]
MVILWWLAPPVVATVLAMLWVSWTGRSGRGEVDRDVAVRRMGEAIARPAKVSRTPTRTAPTSDRSTGVALRRARREPTAPPEAPRPDARAVPARVDDRRSTRRAS